jgi:AbrB family looped-hinge helix DNA binding protein
MPTGTLTSKGQITLPKAVRDELGLKVGDRVAFRIREDGSVIVEAETVEISELRGVLVPRRRGVTIEDMQAAIRTKAAAE